MTRKECPEGFWKGLILSEIQKQSYKDRRIKKLVTLLSA